MIVRIWHGWTTPANADAYETLLKTEIFPGIRAKNLSGFHGIELLRRPAGNEVSALGFEPRALRPRNALRCARLRRTGPHCRRGLRAGLCAG